MITISAVIVALYVALGGALGSVARYLLSVAVQSRAGSFPVATLAINISGSLLLGFLIRYTMETPSVGAEMRLMLTTGFCGGYTTFSTFSFETARLIEDGEYDRAVWYVLLSVIVSLAATFAGFSIARGLLGLRRGG